jgi:hypothetical protein
MASRVEPIHTRLLSVRLACEGHEALRVEGRVLDVRKRGTVALGGVVNGPGVVHDMTVRLLLAAGDLSIREAELSMPTVPFPARPETQGESCRDNEAGFERVVGLRLTNGFLTGLHRAVGSARGCFHVFTLMRLLGPSITWAAERGFTRETGRAFARTITVDGGWDGALLHLRGGVTDLHYVGSGSEEIERALEGEAEAEVAVPDLTVRQLHARSRDGRRGERSSWTEAGLAGVPELVGSSLLRGYSLRLDEVLSARGAQAPLRELLLMLQPVAFQCMPSLAEVRDVGSARRGDRLAARDSCSMWRHDGPLLAENDAAD